MGVDSDEFVTLMNDLNSVVGEWLPQPRPLLAVGTKELASNRLGKPLHVRRHIDKLEPIEEFHRPNDRLQVSCEVHAWGYHPCWWWRDREERDPPSPSSTHNPLSRYELDRPTMVCWCWDQYHHAYDGSPPKRDEHRSNQSKRLTLHTQSYETPQHDHWRQWSPSDKRRWSQTTRKHT